MYLTLTELDNLLYGDAKSYATTGMKTSELERATSDIDDYLRQAGFTPPLTTIPQSLKGRAFDIVNYRLHVRLSFLSDGANQSPLYLDYVNAFKWLQQVASGDVKLEGAADANPSDDVDDSFFIVTGNARRWS
jgi:phage gp36-like protein